MKAHFSGALIKKNAHSTTDLEAGMPRYYLYMCTNLCNTPGNFFKQLCVPKTGQVFS